MTDPLRVLFVCTANICRSPWLEISARGMAGGAPLVFASAGTHGFVDKPMDEVMAQTLPPGAASAFRSRALDPQILSEAELVLVAETRHRSHILRDNPAMVRRVFTVGQFAHGALENPGLHGRELVKTLGVRRSPALAEHDISDPYRKGLDAAREGAAIMSTMLSVIVPRLAGTS